MTEIVVGDARVVLGDCRDVLRTLADNSVDSVVTDPPYEIGFMGRSWDGTGVAYDVTVWEECLRVLKPGGHILAFGGSRTWHRLAVAAEDAGFEIRDSIAWIYGSGFPKSLDVSKAIDKRQGLNQERRLQFTEWMRSTGMTASQANRILQEAGAISENGTMAGHYFDKTQPAIATADLFDKLRPYLPEVPEAIERLVAERTGIEWTAYKQREVIGQKMSGIANKDEKPRHTIGASKAVEVDITTPSTAEAQQWSGWGTALKPAFEPVVVGRKPFGKGVTVAENVLAWGVGGLNIDASRIGSETRYNSYGKGSQAFTQERTATEAGMFAGTKEGGNFAQGRWPANVILDEVTAGLVDEQSGVLKSGSHSGKSVYSQGSTETPSSFVQGMAGKTRDGVFPASEGGASRFFYQAKASKRDRNEGLEGLEDTGAGEMVDRVEGSAGMDSPRAGAGRTSGAKNFHPTVKPTALMRYLIKLVTPPGGTVLDPFAGSGSTGKAALLDGFKFVGAELTAEYLPIIEGRLRWALEQGADVDETLF
jgi:DNA modification methylase